MTGFDVEISRKLRFINAILVIPTQRKIDVIRSQIGDLRVIGIATATGRFLLLRPALTGAFVLSLADEVALTKSPVDELAAHMKKVRQIFGRGLGRRTR